MRIAFIVKRFPCLSETFVLNQITGLIDLGHEVDIFADRADNNSKMHEDVTKYRLLDRVIYPLNINHPLPKQKILRILKGLSLTLQYLPKRPKAVLRSLNPFKYGMNVASFYYLFMIVPFLDKMPYDIIHCHFGQSGNKAVFLRELGAIDGKLITTFHGFDITTYLRTNGNHVYDNLFKKGDLFLPISNCWKEKLIGMGCPENKIVVHRMGIDVQKFAIAQHKIPGNKTVRILTVARLVEKKGVRYGIQAFAKTLKKYPYVEYMIAGDGPLKGELADLIKQLSISKNVKLLGWKDQEEILLLLNRADILLAPSVTSEDGNQEGIPVVIMEALARGIPVISTYHSGIPELVDDGVSGFLVPERDADSLSDRLTYLLDHPEVWPKMGEEGRNKVEKNYNINILNNQLVNLFRGLLDGNARNSPKINSKLET